MKMFVNTSGVPLKITKPRLDGRIVGGTETYDQWTLPGMAIALLFSLTVRLKKKKKKRLSVFVMTKS
jgi:hypothetical protein